MELNQNESKLFTQVDNPKEHKRQTDRAQRAAMTNQNGININK
jgi:hypothetical protein